MSGDVKNAGLLPAFVDYRAIGGRYERLIGQFRAGRHVHAYLFAGPQGIGKKTYARHLASVLFCEREQKPCGECAQCRLIREGRHSSVTEIAPENGKAIPVDRIRELVSVASLHTLDGRERIILFEPMESLTPQAQNCLLKSLEEPDTNVVYFLLSHDPSSLLDTIMSRCIVFKLTPWPQDILIGLLEKLGTPRDQAEQAAVLAGGNVGEALSILTEQADGVQGEALTQILRVSSARDAAQCSAVLKDTAGNADRLLYMLERYLQQCILVKTGLLSPKLLQNTPWGSVIRYATVPELTDLTSQVFTARKLKMSNVNWQSNIDQMILKLLEATSKWRKS